MRARVSIVLAVISAFPAGVLAQCTDWRSGFHLSGPDNEARANTVFDDGTGGGPDLYVGGTFANVSGVVAGRIAKWDGTTWTEVGGGIGVSGTGHQVNALAVYDAGSGAKLYAAGAFNTAGGIPTLNIACWDGTQWMPLGTGLGGIARALCIFDDGSGPALFAGGEFLSAGGNPALRIAKWDGQAWTLPALTGANGTIYALTVHDDGTGSKLYAGGDFTSLDGPAPRVAAYDGSTWTALPGTMNGSVYALRSFDDGSGPDLYAAGDFSQAQGPAHRIARFDGTSWSAVGGGLGITSGNARAYALEVFDNGTGSKLYVAGSFNLAGGSPAQNIAAWNGTAWSTLGSGVTGHTYPGAALTLGIYDDGLGGGARLVVAGEFRIAGGRAVSKLATWRTDWGTVDAGFGLTERVHVLTFDDTLGGGPGLFAAGQFTAAGGTAGVHSVGRWNGASWDSLGCVMDAHVTGLAVFDDGSGEKLYASGPFQQVNGVSMPYVARWDGNSWSPTGPGLTGGGTLFVLDDGTGTALYAGTNKKWNGTTWVPVSWGSFSPDYLIHFDDGGGLKLYGTGTLTLPVGFERRVARRDGSTWTMLGAAFDQEPDRLCVFPDGGVPRLIAVGRFTLEGVQPLPSAAKWDGTSWSALGTGLTYPGGGNPEVAATAVWDDHTGTGAALYVGGRFSQAGGSTADNIARWNGTAWSSVGAGTNNQIYALKVFENGGASELFAGGLFTQAGGKDSSFLARYSNSCSSETGVTYCHGDGSGTACPCGNVSPAADREGCASSLGHGGRLRATGTPSPLYDSLVLVGTGMPNSSALYFQGTTRVNGGAGAVFGDGLRCAGGSVVRLGTKLNSANASQYPGPGDVKISVKGAIPPFSGVTRRYQCWYRNADPTFCTPSTFNLTNAVEILWSL